MSISKVSLTLLVAVAFVLSGCAAGVTPQTAGTIPFTLYSDVQYSNQAMNNEVGDQTGDACMQRILIFTTDGGEDTLQNAVEDAGINEIGSVSNSYTNILGLYEERCVVVSGS